MPDTPEKNDEPAEDLSAGPRDPNLPATQLLEVPEDEGGAPDFEDTTEPNAGSADPAISESLTRKLEELEKEDEALASEWDDEESTVVDDPANLTSE